VAALTYAFDPAQFDDGLADRFVVLAADAETKAFVDTERVRRHGRMRWLARGVARAGLGAFSANALFDTYPLFLLSSPQWADLLDGHTGGRLLDIGAAAGHVTSRLAPLFTDLVATDVSRPMVRRLRQRGLPGLHIDVSSEPVPGGPFDVVALLNVLDRCARPRAMLAAANAATADDGALVISMPLPYDPCWYDGPVERPPLQQLPVVGANWKDAAESLVALLGEHGLRVEALTRAPYISGGDRQTALYSLDTVIVVATRAVRSRGLLHAHREAAPSRR